MRASAAAIEALAAATSGLLVSASAIKGSSSGIEGRSGSVWPRTRAGTRSASARTSFRAGESIGTPRDVKFGSGRSRRPAKIHDRGISDADDGEGEEERRRAGVGDDLRRSLG